MSNRTGARLAAFALPLLLVGCGESAPPPPAEENVPRAFAGAPAADVRGMDRCQPVSGGPPPYFGVMPMHLLELNRRLQDGTLTREAFDDAIARMQVANVHMAAGEFDEACTALAEIESAHRLNP